MDVEDAALSGHDLENVDRVLPLLEDARRQTGGVRACASGNAVLDPDAVPGHGAIQSREAGSVRPGIAARAALAFAGRMGPAAVDASRRAETRGEDDAWTAQPMYAPPVTGRLLARAR